LVIVPFTNHAYMVVLGSRPLHPRAADDARRPRRPTPATRTVTSLGGSDRPRSADPVHTHRPNSSRPRSSAGSMESTQSRTGRSISRARAAEAGATQNALNDSELSRRRDYCEGVTTCPIESSGHLEGLSGIFLFPNLFSGPSESSLRETAGRQNMHPTKR
jgi:hypothetical protein